jgi:hypothetical protein
MASSKATDDEHYPGANQIRCYQAVWIKTKTSAMIALLAKGLKMIDGHQRADDRINGILMVRNKLMGQEGKGSPCAGAQKTGDRNRILFIREQGNGSPIIL